MRVAMLTREYPPEVYGGAGVHVEYLSRELARLVELEVHCFGADRRPAAPGGPAVHAHQPWEVLAGAAPHLGALRPISVDLALAAAVGDVELVHTHTWYTNLAGYLAKRLYGIPHVMTSHSLEPLRPWKREQLGGGYEVSSAVERLAIEDADAVIAVSHGMAADVRRAYPAVDPARIRIVHNGIDPDEYRPDPGTDVLERYGVDPNRPYVIFVGRITRQKGVTYLLDAAPAIDPAAQLVLCAGAPDTAEIGAEVEAKVRAVAGRRGNLLWIERMLAKPEVVQLMTHASVFVCPSVYEPLGIVNLEAMACGTAVVATATGGIPEVVEDGVTGLLVPFSSDGAGTPTDPDRFAADLAERVNRVLADPATAAAMGEAGRVRVLERFTWPAAAERTAAIYRELLER